MNICRTCLRENNEPMQSIREKGKIGNSVYILSDLLYIITNIEVNFLSSEPDKICQSCLLELSRSYNFRQMCVQSDQTIKSMASNKEENYEFEYLQVDNSEEFDEVVDKKPPRMVPIKIDSDEGDSDDYSDDEHSAPFENDSQSGDGSTIKKEVYCQHCDIFLKTTEELKNHNEDHVNKVKQNRTGALECHICLKVLAKLQSYKEHLETHYGNNMYCCKICDKGFNTKYRYQAHMVTHDPNCQHVCEFCSKKFIKKSALTLHLKVHTGEKPFTCDICDYTTRLKYNLTIHLRSHSGERPFQCDECDKSFARPYSLTEHKKTMHSSNKIKDPAKPYECDVCGKCFRTKSILKDEHRPIHDAERQHGCDECGKKFSLRKTLLIHKRLHSPAGDFRCDICDKSFTQKIYMQKHRSLIHTHRSRSYKCGDCDKEFETYHKLRKHKNVDHGGGSSN